MLRPDQGLLVGEVPRIEHVQDPDYRGQLIRILLETMSQELLPQELVERLVLDEVEAKQRLDRTVFAQVVVEVAGTTRRGLTGVVRECLGVALGVLPLHQRKLNHTIWSAVPEGRIHAGAIRTTRPHTSPALAEVVRATDELEGQEATWLTPEPRRCRREPRTPDGFGQGPRPSHRVRWRTAPATKAGGWKVRRSPCVPRDGQLGEERQDRLADLRQPVVSGELGGQTEVQGTTRRLA